MSEEAFENEVYRRTAVFKWHKYFTFKEGHSQMTITQVRSINFDLA